jgi:cytochrome c-type biogenesis protein
MTLLLISFAAGVLTVITPCVLPILPIIIGGSVTAKQKLEILVMILSLVVSIIVFTMILKASTVLIGVDPIVWKLLSGFLVVGLGISYLFPEIWEKISFTLKLQDRSNSLLDKSKEKQGLVKNILMGVSLGPVFTSCSPTYALILATVLPVNFWQGLVYIIVYSLGLGFILLIIALLGRKLTNKLKIVADPKGVFRRVMGVLFILVGVAIIFGIDKQIETALLQNDFFEEIVKFEQEVIEDVNQ